MIRTGALALALSLAAAAAGAQDAPVATAPPPAPDIDAIAAVLDDPQAYSTDVDEEPAPVPPYSPPPYTPLAVSPQPMFLPPLPPRIVSRPKLDRPVLIDETGLTPEGPLAPPELGYDMRVRANIANAQGRQGPLDGGWTVAAADGAKLYNLQLVDPGDSPISLEGAWRSLQRRGVGTTGLIASFERGEASLVVRFARRSGETPTVMTLTPLVDGSWSGQMWEDGKVLSVTMRR